MSDSQTQILLDEERKRKLEMIAKEEGHSQSAAVRGMIDRRYPELFATVQKIGIASFKQLGHEVNSAPVDVFPPSGEYIQALQSVEEEKA